MFQKKKIINAKVPKVLPRVSDKQKGGQCCSLQNEDKRIGARRPHG